MTTSQSDVKTTDNNNMIQSNQLQQSNTEGMKKQSIKPNTEDQVMEFIVYKDKEEKVDLVESKTNLIINYIPPTMNEGELASLFSPYGQMDNIKIVVDPQTGRSRGYGFIQYRLEESAAKALNALNGMQAGNKRLKVAYARPKCKEIQNANLYITNIPQHWTSKDLRPLFNDFGQIVECRILKDEDGKSRGVGFVRMDTHMNAIKAMEGRDRYKPEGNEPALVVKLAQRRNNRRWQNRNNNNNRNNNRNLNKLNQMVNSNTSEYNNLNSGYNRNTSGNRNSPTRSNNKSGYYRQRNNNFNTNQNRQYRPRQTTGFYPMYDAYKQVSQNTSLTNNVNNNNNNNNNQTSNNVNNNNNNQQNSSQSRNFNNSTFNIITYNIPSTYNVDHLIQLYAPYGPIQSVNIQKPNNSKNGSGQAYGVISYFYFDDAQRAQSQTNGKRIGDRRLEVVFQAK